MRQVTIVLGPFDYPIEGDVIGVDYGAYYCARNNIDMIFACGDFDSVTQEEFKLIESSTPKIDKLNPIKDMTDFEHALTCTQDYDSVLVLGALGNRRDHEYVNVILASKDSRITLVDDVNWIKKYDAGQHRIHKDHYKYCSFIVIEEAQITLEGFKYPLRNRKVYPGDTYLTSNEIINESGILDIKSGSLLCIKT